MNHLINAWRALDLTSPSLILPDDLLLLQERKVEFVAHSYDEYLALDICRQTDSRLHVGLLPQPYHGDVLAANVYLLMLNPGLGPGDYYSEARVPDYRAALIANLHQAPGRRFPFLFLDPQFAWHPGARYFRGKLNWLVHRLSEARGISYLDALQIVSIEVCCLELVPYHSATFQMKNVLFKELHSIVLMRSFVAGLIASRKNALFIATRAVSRWALPSAPNVVTYNATQSRSAHLTQESPGGAALLRHYDIYDR